ncbi:MAG: electron transport complex subunit RsxG, partial [Plesiomonas sp.]
MLNTMRRHGITLAIFALVTTGMIVVVHSLTNDKITAQAKLQQANLINQVLPPELYDNDPLKE